MTATTPLTPLTVPLGGDLLIEASAGTGKTYALTTLAARLVVEAEVPIDRLLVVTFTVAATGELRSRLRRTLLAARNATEAPTASANARADQRQASALLRHWQSLGIDEGDANARLLSAVRDLDRASILTIHGFCQRLLAEFAFDGGIPFGFNVSGGNDADVAAAVRDFWRRHIAPALPAQIEFATANGFTIDEVTQWIRERQGRAELQIRGVDEESGDTQAELLAWHQAFANTRAAWLEGATAFLEAMNALSWHKTSGPKVAATCELAHTAFSEDDIALMPLASAGYLGGKSLGRRLYKGQQLPPLALFDRFDDLGAAAEALGPHWLRRMRRDLLVETQRTLRRQAWRKRSLSFDDLLTETERALRRSSRLAARVRERFAVALIDEFQDTDGLQARIFQSIYAARPEPSSGGLALVGDPKQSIYGFRGADVFAYVEASQRFADQPGKRLRLTTNYRSTPALVRALNALFTRPSPFLMPEIEFQASAWPVPEDSQTATATRKNEIERGLVLDAAADPAPLQLRLFPGDDETPARTPFQTVAASGAATEIAALLALAAEGRAKLNGRVLQGADIAVLVRTRVQGQAVAQELRRRGVSSVEMSDASIFQTDAADQLHRLLGALAATGGLENAARLRGALGMAMFALDMGELAALTSDDRAWAHWQQRFGQWRRVWRRAGVATLIRRLLFAPPENCVEHLLRQTDGARRVTDMLHLADLLRQAETSERLSPAGLVEWLSEQRRGALTGDSAQLRLESDERLVKILTVHRAKGLEFPLVFCPFAWYRRRPWRGPTATYHERVGDRYHEILDLDPSGAAHDRQQVEDHAEELRLLYVALTRAQYRCVVTWARAKGSERAPIAWLLHDRDRTADNPVAALRSHERHVSKLDASAWQAEVMAFVDANQGDVAASQLATGDGPSMKAEETSSPALMEARQFKRPLRRIRQMTSYSALAAEAGAAVTEPEHVEVERADHDQREDANLALELLGQADIAAQAPIREIQTPDERKDAFTFPRGRRAGDCLHQLFEAVSNDDTVQEGWREETLRRHGIDPSWAATANDMVEDVRATMLATPKGGRFQPFRIADLAGAVAEMEFQMPALINRKELARCLTEHGYDNPFEGATAANSVDGYLRGFIDLVATHDERWYVIDYKSNWLGDDFPAYAPEALRQAMRRNRYHLQYLIYLTALHRYLRLKLPNYDYAKHIGGAFYLFIRGMTPERPAHGVFHDLPSQACIEAIDKCFGT